jgi:hypothetical protein
MYGLYHSCPFLPVAEPHKTDQYHFSSLAFGASPGLYLVISHV